MNAGETRSLSCPFCGAPQRGFVPSDAVQVKCQYCGGIFLFQPEREEFKYRCVNHPDRLSIGLCNECGKGFCKDCLHPYEVEVKGEDSASLYLCLECLRSRVFSKANRDIIGGVLFLLFGIFYVVLTSGSSMLWFGLLATVMGLIALIYGFSERSEKSRELSFLEKA